MFWLHVANLAFWLAHTALILYAVLGWTIPGGRRLHLATLFAIAASWLLLGLRYGIGYCPLTDWHWRVLRALGERDLPPSFTELLLETLLPIDISHTTADLLTVGGLLFGLGASLSLLLRGRR